MIIVIGLISGTVPKIVKSGVISFCHTNVIVDILHTWSNGDILVLVVDYVNLLFPILLDINVFRPCRNVYQSNIDRPIHL